ncbi:MAG: cryptochrome/photolyase family protein [Thermoleophilia bacterium]|nr:cryptochrome/photolyase family protein [Thermoleophilia bacterium]
MPELTDPTVHGDELVLVLPWQLFDPHPLVAHRSHAQVVVWEDPLHFGDDEYDPGWHAATLAYRRAAIDAWVAAHPGVQHLAWEPDRDMSNTLRAVIESAPRVHVCDPVDEWSERRLRSLMTEAAVELVVHPTPAFLLDAETARTEFAGSPRRMRMAPFYQRQRRRFGLLLDPDDEPVGGRWSFDEDNRKRLPKDVVGDLPAWPWPTDTPAHQAAADWARTVRPEAPGSARVAFPTTAAAARAHLRQFAEERFYRFGPYEDAMHPGSALLFHGAISPMLNHGLLTPREVIDTIVEAAAADDRIELASVEGFVRQVIGWREYMRAAYLVHASELRQGNHWGHWRALPDGMLTARTGIAPVDDVLDRVLELGWCHHIERLMVIGNYLFLTETHPDEAYRCFTALFTDATDWVMLTNSNGMSQDAASGVLTTKPYMSGSAYLKRMGWPKGPWCEIWDALYWNFVDRHAEGLRAHPRMSQVAANLARLDPERLQHHRDVAAEHLDEIRRG